METSTLLKHIIFILFTSLFATSILSSYALEPSLPQIIGQVVWVKGSLKATLPNAETRVLTRRSVVYEHDTLVTDPVSTGEIVFTDDSVLSLRQDSTIQIDQYKYGKGTAPKEDTFVANVAKGGFRTITGAISKNNPGGYKATTPVATIGVSGTVYSVYFNRIKGTLAAKLDKGIISISNEKGKLQLTKCTSDKTFDSNCINQVYAEVNGTDTAPTAVSHQPTVFNNEPPLTATAFPKPSSSGTVGSFCIN